ncbi:uncharacterized protein LOC143563359 isoform X1 [Bidens hawaiensis]|uniref:uncharacterized protein LOC143563359 isoform X1 n=1 Tax=Bidens hawaiensis TaxID=980011 RepID=UPI00404B34F6
MCVRARLPISSAKGAQTSSSSSNSFGETDSEPARSGIYKHRSLDSILKNEPNRTSNLEGLKLYNRLQGNAISADLSGSFQSIVSEEIDSSSNKKGTSFKDLLANKNTNETETTDTQDTLVEKTLYVDTVQIIKSPQENKQPVFNESLKSDMFADEPKNDQETKKFEDHEVGLEVVDNIINDGDKQLKPSKTEVVDDIIYEGDKQLKASESRVFELPVPPPLPKSPSDSWLCRALPSVPLKNAHMRWNNKYPSSNMLTNDPKADDNIRLRNPQGQLYSIPES